MEYVPGGSIAWMLSKFQSFDEEIISKFTRQILEAVDYLHNKDIVHRYVNQVTEMAEYLPACMKFDAM